MRKKSTTGTYVATSNIKGAGNGLFARHDYKYGETVCVYLGKITDTQPEGLKSNQ